MGRSGIRRRKARRRLSRLHGPLPPLPEADDHRYITPLAEVHAAHAIAQAWSTGDGRTRRRAALAAAIIGLPLVLGLGIAAVALVVWILGAG